MSLSSLVVVLTALVVQYLGQLIDGLTPENLSVAISGGVLDLRNLKFKPEVCVWGAARL